MLPIRPTDHFTHSLLAMHPPARHDPKEQLSERINPHKCHPLGQPPVQPPTNKGEYTSAFNELMVLKSSRHDATRLRRCHLFEQPLIPLPVGIGSHKQAFYESIAPKNLWHTVNTSHMSQSHTTLPPVQSVDWN